MPTRKRCDWRNKASRCCQAPCDAREELELGSLRANPRFGVRGRSRHRGARRRSQAFERVTELYDRLPQTSAHALLLNGMAWGRFTRADHEGVLELTRRILPVAEQHDDPALLVFANNVLAVTLHNMVGVTWRRSMRCGRASHCCDQHRARVAAALFLRRSRGVDVREHLIAARCNSVHRRSTRDAAARSETRRAAQAASGAPRGLVVQLRARRSPRRFRDGGGGRQGLRGAHCPGQGTAGARACSLVPRLGGDSAR